MVRGINSHYLLYADAGTFIVLFFGMKTYTLI